MRLPGDLGHLTYCMNVHRGETWEAVRDALATGLPAVRAALSAGGPFGIGLRLSANALAGAAQAEALEWMRFYLADENCYVFTLNAFPYGPFHGTPVKADVYLPDWRSDERLRYTDAAADYLAALLPDGVVGSVSTVPGCFRPLAGPTAAADMADRFLRHAAHLVALERRSGRTIALAIEPEPACFLETTADAVAFFRDHLFSAAAAARLTQLAGLDRAGAEQALHRHLGLCLDLCHAAVEFEEPAQAIAMLSAAGIPVAKLQVSAGLRIERIDAGTPALLAPFDDGIYLHQVVARSAGELTRYTDLGEAFAALDADPPSAHPREWRVHYHVPLFLADLGPFSSTQCFVRAALDLHRRQPISSHLEVETYTWDVLPERYRTDALPVAIARELRWVRTQLAA